MKSLQIEKKKKLMDCAMTLFQKQGIDETSVSDIAKSADLAKGTFYVYFKDKEALIQEVIMTHNIQVFNDLMELSYQDSFTQHIPWAHAYLKRVMQFYKDNPQILRMIQRCFHREDSHAAFVKEMRSQVHLFDAFIEALRRENELDQDVMNRFVLMMSITGMVSYNAIYHKQPDTMENVEAIFYENMCHSFAQGKEDAS